MPVRVPKAGPSTVSVSMPKPQPSGIVHTSHPNVSAPSTGSQDTQDTQVGRVRRSHPGTLQPLQASSVGATPPFVITSYHQVRPGFEVGEECNGVNSTLGYIPSGVNPQGGTTLL